MESIGSNRWRRRRKDREAEPSILIGWWAGVTWDRAKSCWDSLISAAHCSSTPAPMSLSLSDSVAFLSPSPSNSGRFDGLFARSCH